MRISKTRAYLQSLYNPVGEEYVTHEAICLALEFTLSEGERIFKRKAPAFPIDVAFSIVKGRCVRREG